MGSLPEFLNKKMAEHNLTKSDLHRLIIKKSGEDFSPSYLQKILSGEVSQLSFKKLKALSDAFSDHFVNWLIGAGYLDGIELPTVDQVISAKYGDLLDDERLENLAQRLKNLTPEKQAKFFEMVDFFLNGME